MPYILNTKQQIREMLSSLRLDSEKDLFAHLPQEVLLSGPLSLPGGLSEEEVKTALDDIAGLNSPLSSYNSFLGAGCYAHYLPAALSAVISRPEFYTAYTPYQPECSQGTLQAIYEFQTYICILTGMDAANASVYDGATALAESVLMSLRINKRSKVFVSSSVHPEYRKVLATYLQGPAYTIEEIPFTSDGSADLGFLADRSDDGLSCAVIQNPDFFGVIEDLSEAAEIVHGKGGLLISVADPFTLPLLKAPGDQGADIVCGEIQGFGSALSCGGPGCGFLSAREKFLRQIPGRIAGRTKDKEGRTGYCLTLQTREQHIRRERATSNICSNQALNALAATVYMGLLGRIGLKNNALSALNMSRYLYAGLKEIKGVSFPFSGTFFHEFVWSIDNAPELEKKLRSLNCIPGLLLDKFYPEMKNYFLSCCTELTAKENVDKFIGILKKLTEKG